MQGMQFAIIAKFLPCSSSASGEAFQLPNSFIKSPSPPPPSLLIFIQFLSNLLLSCPKAECPLPCPAFLPCTAAAHLSSPLPVSPLPYLSAATRPCRRQHPCTPPSPTVSLSCPFRTRQFALATRCRRTLLCLLPTPASLPHV